MAKLYYYNEERMNRCCKIEVQSVLNKIVEEHQKGQKKFILTTSDDMEHYICVDSLLDLVHQIHYCFLGQLDYDVEDFVSLEEESAI